MIEMNQGFRIFIFFNKLSNLELVVIATFSITTSFLSNNVSDVLKSYFVAQCSQVWELLRCYKGTDLTVFTWYDMINLTLAYKQ